MVMILWSKIFGVMMKSGSFSRTDFDRLGEVNIWCREWRARFLLGWYRSGRGERGAGGLGLGLGFAGVLGFEVGWGWGGRDFDGEFWVSCFCQESRTFLARNLISWILVLGALSLERREMDLWMSVESRSDLEMETCWSAV
jgi:hypothetical protein